MTISTKFITQLLIILGLLGIIAFLFFNENGILKYLKLKNEIEKIDQEIIEADITLQKLQAEIDSLMISKIKIEQVARERFHMFKPNEQVLQIEEN